MKLTKPLPKGLIHELLPVTPVADLPIPLPKRRYPARLLDRLNLRPGLAATRAHRTPRLRLMNQGQLDAEDARHDLKERALYDWFDGDRGTGDIEAMLTPVMHFWAAVATLFTRPNGMRYRVARASFMALESLRLAA